MPSSCSLGEFTRQNLGLQQSLWKIGVELRILCMIEIDCLWLQTHARLHSRTHITHTHTGYQHASHVNGSACRQRHAVPKAITHQGMWTADRGPRFARRTGCGRAHTAPLCNAGYGTAAKEDTTRLLPLTNV